MQRESTQNWIDHIINRTLEKYNGREIVIWGKYEVSECIKDKLKENFGIDISFYVDSDKEKVDERQVYSPECLYGKSDKYFVIVPIAFYHSIKEKLTRGGYKTGIDYYYFCDCVLQQDSAYYEDSHGNKIIGGYQGLKIVFSGFCSVIEIGKGVQFKNTIFYIHNNSKIVIENDVRFQESSFNIDNNSKIVIGNNAWFEDTDFHVGSNSKIVIGDNAKFIENCFRSYLFSEIIFGQSVYVGQNNIIVGESAKLRIKSECRIDKLSINEKKCAEITLGEETIISSDTDRKTHWNIGEYAKIAIGNKGRFRGQAGSCILGNKALLKIGKGFSINGNYRIVLNMNTSMFIGEDCMFSYDISIRGDDGHSIFDVENRRNINSCDDIIKDRKIDIGNHVWVGERAYIMHNTCIGDGSIIGAMSFVKSSIPNNCIAAGIPARVIRKNVAWCRDNGASDIMKCGQEYIHYTGDL